MSGYNECMCCGEVIIDDDLCESCIAADCNPEDGRGCQVLNCVECCDGEGPPASWCSDQQWHSNCDGPCPNHGKAWQDEQAKRNVAAHQKEKEIEAS